MEIKTLLKSNLKSHRGTVLGVFVLLLLVSLSLGTVLTVWNNSSRYVDSEMDRLGYGDITAWVSGLSDVAPLAEEISALDKVESVGAQSLIFSEYEIGEQESDSEGQLITYDPEHYPYKFFADDLSGYTAAPTEIAPGEVYVSSSMVSMFGVRIGDSITFPIARSGGDVTLTVAGFYEDPFMGSSMIGMKGFLVNGQDHEEIAVIIEGAGIDSLAREGFMLHIAQNPGSTLTTAQFNAYLNENTGLQSYTEFTHSKDAISGFMLTLQNVFTSLLLAFVAILLLASMAVLSHSIGSTIEQDYANMGILKTMGFTSGKLRAIQLLQYLIAALCATAAGALLAIPAARSDLQDDGDRHWDADSVCSAAWDLSGGAGSHSSLTDGLCLVPHRENSPDFSRERHPGNLEEIPGKQKDSFPHPKERAYLLAGSAAASQRKAAVRRSLSGSGASGVFCFTDWPGRRLAGAKRRRIDGRF